MIKVDVISGFLGAGKTTLIKKMYAHAFKNEQVVLIENEFGKVGVDAAFLQEAGIEIKEINSGCICCTLVGDFNRSLEEIIERFHPDRVIIEPSGVGKLSDIIESIHRFGDALTLNIVATVVDAKKCKKQMRNFGEFYVDQVKQANTVVISKGDVAGAEVVQEAYDLVRSLNPRANIVTTAVTEMEGDRLLAVLEEDASLMDELMEEVVAAAKAHRHHHHHHHEDEDGEECECHHHHHDEEEDEDEEHHHHHEDEDDEDDEECECHHHHHDEDEDEEGEEHHHHHHDDDDDEECECHHHHDDDDDDDEGEEHHHHHHGHDADEVFESWGVETAKSYAKPELEAALEALCTDRCGNILRSKGIVKASDREEWYYFDLVAGDYEIRLGAPDYTGRLCVIGAGLDRDEIKAVFAL